MTTATSRNRPSCSPSPTRWPADRLRLPGQEVLSSQAAAGSGWKCRRSPGENDRGSKTGTQNGTLVKGTKDQNLRSISCWFKFDPHPNGCTCFEPTQLVNSYEQMRKPAGVPRDTASFSGGPFGERRTKASAAPQEIGQAMSRKMKCRIWGKGRASGRMEHAGTRGPQRAQETLLSRERSVCVCARACAFSRQTSEGSAAPMLRPVFPRTRLCSRSTGIRKQAVHLESPEFKGSSALATRGPGGIEATQRV